ncbi:MAG: hypothetical protein ACRDP1_04285 [Nocardioidaceae bacterium]
MAESTTESTQRHTAGLFDVRTIIGALLGIYGIVLLVMAGVASTKGGVNSNLWVGIGLVVAAAIFLVWAYTRPIVVDDAQVEKAREEAEEHPGH